MMIDTNSVAVYDTQITHSYLPAQILYWHVPVTSAPIFSSYS